MFGAIVGDVVGSKFEFFNYRDKDFKLFDEDSFFTDDSVMTIAICKAIMDCNGNYDELSQKVVESMQFLGER